MAGQDQMGSWAFIIGVIIAIIGGAFSAFVPGSLAGYIPLVLIILGVVVGVLNIKDKEVSLFLIAAVALLSVQNSAGGLGEVPMIGEALVGIVQHIAVFVAPAALIVGLKAIKGIAQD